MDVNYKMKQTIPCREISVYVGNCLSSITMSIILHVDDLLRKKGCTVQELADAVGISRVNMSHIKTGDIRALRLTTLDGICDFFDCQPGDVLEHIPDDID